MPASALWFAPDTNEIAVGAPAFPFTLIVATGSPDTVTVTEFNPAVLPSVQVPTGVGPPETVLVGMSGIVPPPAVTATVTLTPPSVFPLPSLTTKVGDDVSGKPAVPSTDVETVGETEAGFGGAVDSLQPATKPAVIAIAAKRIDRNGVAMWTPWD